MKLLVILIIVLAIIAIVQLSKVYELTRAIRKTREEEISPADNKLQANLILVWMFLFFAGVLYLYSAYGEYLPEPASKHGVNVDWLMSVNIWMITVMFFIMNAMLFLVAWKYSYNKNRKAKFFSHDNRLEMVWTLIPGVSMAFIIVFGLITWNEITGPASENALQIEVYSKQFDWTVRYPGADKEFGASNYNLISTDNPLGMVTGASVKKQVEAIDQEIVRLKEMLAGVKSRIKELSPATPNNNYMWFDFRDVIADSASVIEEQIYTAERHKQRILDLDDESLGGDVTTWTCGADDQIVKTELVIPVGQEVEFLFRSQDVIHSAYMPHFRAQMNTVPGVPTRFKMTPTITTAEMRKKVGDDKFNYILLCNKVCGAAHSNMKIPVRVVTPEEYATWLKEQKTYIAATDNNEMPADSLTKGEPGAPKMN